MTGVGGMVLSWNSPAPKSEVSPKGLEQAASHLQSVRLPDMLNMFNGKETGYAGYSIGTGTGK
jgi:hypothetical protein